MKEMPSLVHRAAALVRDRATVVVDVANVPAPYDLTRNDVPVFVSTRRTFDFLQSHDRMPSRGQWLVIDPPLAKNKRTIVSHFDGTRFVDRPIVDPRVRMRYVPGHSKRKSACVIEHVRSERALHDPSPVHRACEIDDLVMAQICVMLNLDIVTKDKELADRVGKGDVDVPHDMKRAMRELMDVTDVVQMTFRNGQWHERFRR